MIEQRVELSEYVATRDGGTVWLFKRPVAGCTHIYTPGSRSIPVVIEEKTESGRKVFAIKRLRQDKP